MTPLRQAIEEATEQGRAELVKRLQESQPSEIDVVVAQWQKEMKIRYAEICAKFAERPVTPDTLLG
jgi:hypothetical protein